MTLRAPARWIVPALLLAGCEEAADPPPAGDAAGAAASHEHHAAAPAPAGEPLNPKHAHLLQIAKQIRESSNMYFGEVPLRELEATDAAGLTVEEAADLDFRKATLLFQHGREAEAEKLLLQSVERAPTTYAKFMLGLTQLRLGELENCLAHHSPESCVYPIRGGGVHQARAGAEGALAVFQEIFPLTPRPLRPKVKWFATLSAMACGTYPDALDPGLRVPPELLESPYEIGRFPDVAMGAGVAVLDLAGGVALDDFDGDGRLDVVTSTAALEGQLRYFRNDGDGTFSERTGDAGLLGQIGGMNLVHADYDGDGDRDLLLLRGGWLGTHGRMPNSLLRNRGDGTFEDVTNRAGLGKKSYPCQSAAFADYDLDGDLDLFFGNETPPPASGMKYPSELFRNEGDGTFTDVSAAAGVETFKLVKGVAWGDWDGDRYPDLFVSNQFEQNRFYHNNGDGTFTDVAETLGLAEPRNSFSTWFWDYDNDGGLDLFVAGYGGNIGDFAKSYVRAVDGDHLNALFRNENGVPKDHAREAGLTLQALTMGAGHGDLDNDGWLDFYLGTGAPDFDALLPNLMYRNDGRGGFQDVTASGGFGNLQKGHAIAFGDVDNDGDQDVYAQIGGMYPYDDYFNSLFLNPGHGNRWITLELVGTESNRDALGSRVVVRFTENGAPRQVVRWVWPRGSFGSGTLRQEIGLGRAERIESVEVYWPKSDTTQRFEGLKPDAFYRITEHRSEAETLRRPAVPVSAGHP